MTEEQERRQFTRISFDAPVEIEQDGLSWISTVVDISLKGILIEGRDLTFDRAKPVRISIHLNQDAQILLSAEWANDHSDGNAFHWLHVDLESMIHLRRLLELNTSDEELLNRELAKLCE